MKPAGVVLAVILTMTASALALGGRGSESRPALESPTILSAAGEIRIGNSRTGQAVIEARNMLPGQVRQGEVTISNPNLQPLTMSLESRLVGDPKLAAGLNLMISRPGRGSLYAGRLAAMPRLPLGELAPGERRLYRFVLELPRGSDNDLQGRRGSLDLTWSARAAGPPPRCRLRDMRARFFIFRGRNRIRLVSRYRAAVSARVQIDFYERRKNGDFGRKVGTLSTRFGSHPHRWKRNRVARKRPRSVMKRFRRIRRGFVAQLRVSGAPGYCRQYLNLDLVELKRFYGQYVWFQRGSFRTR